MGTRPDPRRPDDEPGHGPGLAYRRSRPRRVDAPSMNLRTVRCSPTPESASLRPMPRTGRSPRSSPRSETAGHLAKGGSWDSAGSLRTQPERGRMNRATMAQKQRTLACTALDNPSHRFTNLYSLMHWRPWIEGAAKRVLARPGSSTAGVDGTTRDAFRKQFDAEITHIVRLLKTKTYQPLPVRRVFIPKRNGKTRPLGIPTVTAYCGTVQRAFRFPVRDAPVPPTGGPAGADPLHASSSGRPHLCL
jgi:hypothetical protein